VNAGARFENRNRFVSITSFDIVEASFADHFRRIHSQQKFILDDKNDAPLGRLTSHDTLRTNVIQVQQAGIDPGKVKATNRAAALGNVHCPARMSRGAVAHHISNHRLAEGARCIVVN
jgi:hypothetical protein